MPGTFLLDRTRWDLLVDTSGNIAVAQEPYALAQDAASVVKLFKGEDYYNITRGMPYFEEVLGYSPPWSLIKALWEADVLNYVPNTVEAAVFIQSFVNRVVTGQVQCTSNLGTFGLTVFQHIVPMGAATTSL
jgi:hypothetical protein